MKLKDIMTSDVVTIESDASLQQAAQIMASLDIGVLPVFEGEQLIGVITDRDITVRAAARGLDPKRAAVRMAMTETAVSCEETDDITQGAKQMMNQQIRRLPILDNTGNLVGIVSLSDLSKALLDKCVAGEVLLRISETSMPVALARD